MPDVQIFICDSFRFCRLGFQIDSFLRNGVSQAVQEFGNRIFVMRSDLPYLPLDGPIPTPDRSSMFLLSSTNGLPLPSQDELLLRFSTLGCTIDRVLWLNQMTCYVTLVDRSQEVEIAEAIRAAEWPLMFGPYRSPSEFQEPLIRL